MRISNGIIFIWSGTNASIPAGWSRVTGLDSKYLKGAAAATDPNTTGGSSSHTHTSSSHTHTISDHTHTITLSAGQGGRFDSENSLHTPVGESPYHTHAAFASGSMINQSVSSIAATYSSVSNDPSYTSVIFITPTTTATVIASGIIGLADSAAPTSFNICDGSSSTPNYVGRFLKGAGTGADPGTQGGSSTNVHNITHVHTTSHDHNATTSPGSSGSSSGVRSGGTGVLWNSHIHTVTPSTATPSTSDTISLTTTETVEPTFTKLLAVKASADVPLPIGIIALWLGSLASIPYGWRICDGNNGTVDMRDRHLKITGTVGEVGNTGGNNSHGHAAQSHTHTVSHNHSIPTQYHYHVSANVQRYDNESGAIATQATYHSPNSCSTENFTLSSQTTTGNTSSNEPEYRTVAFIKSTTQSFTDPANVYASDGSYATVAATSGVVGVAISTDGGTTFGTILTKTFGAAETVETYGNGSTELWGFGLTRADLTDTNLRVRVSVGSASEIYQGFGFTTGSDILTGLEIAIEAKYDSGTISIDHLKAKIYYGTSVLQVQAGSMAFASDGRKNGEGAGNGTGVLAFYDGNSWIAVDSGQIVAA